MITLSMHGFDDVHRQGITDVFSSTHSFFQPSLMSAVFISSAISSYLDCVHPAVSQSILSTPIMICFTPNNLMKCNICLGCTCDHVFDKVAVAWGIDDCVVP